MFTKDKVGKL